MRNWPKRLPRSSDGTRCTKSRTEPRTILAKASTRTARTQRKKGRKKGDYAQRSTARGEGGRGIRTTQIKPSFMTRACVCVCVCVVGNELCLCCCSSPASLRSSLFAASSSAKAKCCHAPHEANQLHGKGDGPSIQVRAHRSGARAHYRLRAVLGQRFLCFRRPGSHTDTPTKLNAHAYMHVIGHAWDEENASVIKRDPNRLNDACCMQPRFLTKQLLCCTQALLLQPSCGKCSSPVSGKGPSRTRP